MVEIDPEVIEAAAKAMDVGGQIRFDDAIPMVKRAKLHKAEAAIRAADEKRGLTVQKKMLYAHPLVLDGPDRQTPHERLVSDWVEVEDA